MLNKKDFFRITLLFLTMIVLVSGTWAGLLRQQSQIGAAGSGWRGLRRRFPRAAAARQRRGSARYGGKFARAGI